MPVARGDCVSVCSVVRVGCHCCRWSTSLINRKQLLVSPALRLPVAVAIGSSRLKLARLDIWSLQPCTTRHTSVGVVARIIQKVAGQVPLRRTTVAHRQ